MNKQKLEQIKKYQMQFQHKNVSIVQDFQSVKINPNKQYRRKILSNFSKVNQIKKEIKRAQSVDTLQFNKSFNSEAIETYKIQDLMNEQSQMNILKKKMLKKLGLNDYINFNNKKDCTKSQLNHNEIIKLFNEMDDAKNLDKWVYQKIFYKKSKDITKHILQQNFQNIDLINPYQYNQKTNKIPSNCLLKWQGSKQSQQQQTIEPQIQLGILSSILKNQIQKFETGTQSQPVHIKQNEKKKYQSFSSKIKQFQNDPIFDRQLSISTINDELPNRQSQNLLKLNEDSIQQIDKDISIKSRKFRSISIPSKRQQQNNNEQLEQQDHQNEIQNQVRFKRSISVPQKQTNNTVIIVKDLGKNLRLLNDQKSNQLNVKDNIDFKQGILKNFSCDIQHDCEQSQSNNNQMDASVVQLYKKKISFGKQIDIDSDKQNQFQKTVTKDSDIFESNSNVQNISQKITNKKNHSLTHQKSIMNILFYKNDKKSAVKSFIENLVAVKQLQKSILNLDEINSTSSSSNQLSQTSSISTPKETVNCLERFEKLKQKMIGYQNELKNDIKLIINSQKKLNKSTSQGDNLGFIPLENNITFNQKILNTIQHHYGDENQIKLKKNVLLKINNQFPKNISIKPEFKRKVNHTFQQQQLKTKLQLIKKIRPQSI